MADRNDTELSPLTQNSSYYDMPNKKSDTISQYSVDIDNRASITSKFSGQPRMGLVEAVRCERGSVIDAWIEISKNQSKCDKGNNIIDQCNDEGMNAVHTSVMRNKVDILIKLAGAGADLEKCTEDDGKNPPLVLAAHHLAKVEFEEEITKEVTPERDDSDKHLPILRVTEVDHKTYSKTEHVSRNVAFSKQLGITDKDTKSVHGAEKIMEEKGKVPAQTTFHILLQMKVNVNGYNEAGLTALHVACDRGIFKMVENLLQSEKIDINVKDKQDNTPMHLACTSGEKDIVRSLIEHGASLLRVSNKEGMTPLHMAVVEQKLEVVKLILEVKAGIKKDLLMEAEAKGHTSFLLAIKAGNEEMVKLLMDNRADKMVRNYSGANAIHLAASHNKVKIMKLIYDAGAVDLFSNTDLRNHTPLHYAAKSNQIEALQFLLDKNVDRDTEDFSGMTPLLMAAENGSTEVVVKLLKNGALVEAVDYNNNNIVHFIVNQGNINMLKEVIKLDGVCGLCKYKKEDGNTPLHSSCHKGNVEMIKEFLDNNVDVDETNRRNQTPLHLACMGGHHEAVTELLKKGARQKVTDNDGKTPLHWACGCGHLETVKVLINNDADIDPLAKEIGTPLTYAAKNGHEEVVEYLVKLKADVDGKISKDKLVMTPLIAASQKNHVRIVEYLLKHNANVTHVYHHSRLNCLGEAIRKGQSDVALAIIQSDQWEDAMSQYDERDEITPMRLLIRSMPEVATVVLERCITDNKSKDISETHPKYCITYNYEYLEDYKEEDSGKRSSDLLSISCESLEESGLKKSDKIKDTKRKTLPFKWGPSSFKKQEHPLKVMVESQGLELLKHELVTKLLNNKWKSFGVVFYLLNMFTYLIFLACLTTFALMSPTPNSPDCLSSTAVHQCSLLNGDTCVEELFPNEPISENDVRKINGTDYVICRATFTQTTTNQENVITTSEEVLCYGIVTINAPVDDDCTEDHNQSFLRVFATIGIISTVIRLLLEGVQLLRNHFYYFLDLENWLEVCLFIGSIIFMISGLQSRCFCPTSWQWQLGAMVVFIAWLNMVLFLKKLYLTGIYVVMFVDILYTFMKMILLSVLFVISFGLAFYMLFFRPGNRSSFSSPGRSMVKTIMMTTGEFEFDDIFFNSQQDAEEDRHLYYPQVAYTLWIVFIILMPIILTNLLVGLAVDDIKGVQETAALKRLALQVALTLDIEDLMFSKIRTHFRKKTEKVYPNRHDSWWHKFISSKFPALQGKRKSKFHETQSHLTPLEHIQAEITQQNKEVIMLKMLIKDLMKNQDLILEHLALISGEHKMIGSRRGDSNVKDHDY